MGADKETLDINGIISLLDSLANVASGIVDFAGEMKGKYGFIHKQAIIKYRGKEGRLVWDYILFNELTFEDSETGKQYSLGMSASDKKTEAIFNELVSRYGV